MKITNVLVVSVGGADISQIIAKLQFCVCDVRNMTIFDPYQLYGINDYDFDALIISDSSRNSTLSGAAYRILRVMSPDVILIGEGRSYIDQNITNNIYSQFDAFISFDADLDDIQLALKNAIQNREFRLKAMTQSSNSRPCSQVFQERFRRVPTADTTSVWVATLFGLFWIAAVIGVASLFINSGLELEI